MTSRAEVPVDVAQRLARHPRERPLENFLVETGAARTFCEPDHVDLHAGKEPFRRFVEDSRPTFSGQGDSIGPPATFI